MRRFASVLVSVLSIPLVLGCSTTDDDPMDVDEPTDPDDPMDPMDPMNPDDSPAGFVFVLGNQAERNEVVMFRRSEEGLLEEVGAFPTGGLGSGGGLGSQTAISLTDDGGHLLAVNAGSNEVSLLALDGERLALVDIVDSGGERPISVTSHGDRVYVVNGAGAGSVTGYAIANERLTPIDGAAASLSSAIDPTGPAQIGLSPDKGLLVVTEKMTNNIVSYEVAADGSLGAPIVNPSEGMTPFGFEFTADGALIVSEAFGGNANASAASSYESDINGNLIPLSSSVASGQSAACWVELAGFGTIAYTTNTASNTISGYNVDVDATLTLFDDGGETATLGDGNSPIDMALSADERFLYVLTGASDTIYTFAIEDDGSLTRLPGDISVPGASVGLAAF